MPPKVKCSAPETMATQPADETQTTELGCIPDEQPTPNVVLSHPKEQDADSIPLDNQPKSAESKNGKSRSASKRHKVAMASLVAMEISNDVEIHPYVVQRILDSLEKTAVTCLRDSGVFRMNFMTARLRTLKAQKESGKRVAGRAVNLKAKPERRSLKIAPTRIFKRKCI